MDGLYFGSLLCTIYCTICSCEKVQHRSTVYHTLGAHIDQRLLSLGCLQNTKGSGEKKKRTRCSQKRSGDPEKSTEQVHSQTSQETEKTFLGYPGIPAWNLLQPQKSVKVAGWKARLEEKSSTRSTQGSEGQWTLITVSITILEVPNCVAITEGDFSDWEGNTCDTIITQVLTYILLGIWLKLLLEDVNRIYSRVNKNNNHKLF